MGNRKSSHASHLCCNKHERRQFLGQAARLLVAVFPFALLNNACSFDEPEQEGLVSIKGGRIRIDLSQPSFKTLKSVGHGCLLTLPENHPALIVTRVSTSEAAAFSAACSHAGYPVGLPQNNILTCQSGHGGSFDLRGRVLSPPPTADLHRYHTELSGNTITIDLNRGS